MLNILARIMHGQGRLDDIDRLRQLCDTVGKGSLCGLGQTAPNPVLTTLRYFEHEYLEAIDKSAEVLAAV
jgi:NADH:ubiquinone oxidoreductase subunit F (NADH-binding)